MLKISAVIMVTAACAGLLASGPSGFGVAATTAGVEAAVVRVKTIAIRSPVSTMLVSTFEPSSHWQARPGFRIKMPRMAALD